MILITGCCIDLRQDNGQTLVLVTVTIVKPFDGKFSAYQWKIIHFNQN